MAFGIGINMQKADAGAVKGIQKEVACECWFTSSGKLMPLMIKVQDEGGEVRTIRQIMVHSQEKKMYAGIPAIEFDCTLTVLEQAIPVRLIYYQTEGKWVLNFR